jgi:cytoplasmic iron level regulating protein YaaA (DUF328/UPF0246 family)
MTTLLAVLSPAKRMDLSSPADKGAFTDILFPEMSQEIMRTVSSWSVDEIKKRMAVNDALAMETHARHQSWKWPADNDVKHAALFLFQGEVYRGLDARSLSKSAVKRAQSQLRILSGLYGALRASDGILPYRLMMGTPFAPNAQHKSLVSFWSEAVTTHIQSSLKTEGVLVNLASEEYSSVIQPKTLQRTILRCSFMEGGKQKPKVVSTYAKLARGKMARYLLENGITKPNDLKSFQEDGYVFDTRLSNEEHYIFIR